MGGFRRVAGGAGPGADAPGADDRRFLRRLILVGEGGALGADVDDGVPFRVSTLDGFAHNCADFLQAAALGRGIAGNCGMGWRQCCDCHIVGFDWGRVKAGVGEGDGLSVAGGSDGLEVLAPALVVAAIGVIVRDCRSGQNLSVGGRRRHGGSWSLGVLRRLRTGNCAVVQRKVPAELNRGSTRRAAGPSEVCVEAWQ